MLSPLVEEITDILNRPKGASLTYHVGFLAKDRERPTGLLRSSRDARRVAIDETGTIAMRLSDEGKVALTQRKLGSDVYQYIAQRI